MKIYSKIIAIVWIVLGIGFLAYAIYINVTEDFRNAMVPYSFSALLFLQFVVRKKFLDKRLNR